LGRVKVNGDKLAEKKLTEKIKENFRGNNRGNRNFEKKKFRCAETGGKGRKRIRGGFLILSYSPLKFWAKHNESLTCWVNDRNKRPERNRDINIIGRKGGLDMGENCGKEKGGVNMVLGGKKKFEVENSLRKIGKLVRGTPGGRKGP